MIERPQRRRPPRKPKRVRKSKRPQVTIKYVSVAPIHLNSSEKIDWALSTIASEKGSNRGIYPYTDGLPDIQEVLRRAGLYRTYLERKGDSARADLRRQTLKDRIKTGLSEINGMRPIEIVDESSAPSDKRAESQELRRLRQLWCERELEMIETESTLADARKELAALKDETLKLRAELENTNLHILKPGQ
jgi:hypothetical protein